MTKEIYKNAIIFIKKTDMNIALITAGGIGKRCGMRVPKQFYFVEERPVIIYTLEVFEKHPDIDVIAVSCLAGWEEKLRGYARDFGINKLKHIVRAGETNQESICHGIAELAKHYGDESMVLVHDAARPLVTSDIITDCLSAARKYGNAVACIPCQEPLLRSDCEAKEEPRCGQYYSREGMLRAQAPQAFALGTLKWAHKEAALRCIHNTTASCVLMHLLGVKLYYSESSTSNIKITTRDDMALFASKVGYMKGKLQSTALADSVKRPHILCS